MEQAQAIFTWLMTQGPSVLAAVNGALVALIALCLLIPGEQPEKFLQKVVDVLGKISRK